MNTFLLLTFTLGIAGSLFLLVLLRYRKRKLFLDPFNFYLLNYCLYFTFQVPFIFFPGNLYMIGRGYDQLWPEIWKCFVIETAYMAISVGVVLLLFSSFARRRLSTLTERVIQASTYILGGHKLYILFLIPVAVILGIFVAKYGASLLLIDKLGAAKARTVILRDAASFRFLFNFASTVLAMVLFYVLMIIVDSYQQRRFPKAGLYFLILTGGGIMGFVVTGTRSFILNPLIMGITLSLMFTPRHNKASKVLLSGLALILFASALDILRSSSTELFLFNIFFKGNTFADFRDFVWSYYHFHAKGLDFWQGRTYLASWLSFIPASMFPFRDEWAFGRAIIRVIGWSNTDQFGIRPGIAGGMYYNGGVGLVLVTAFFRGLWLFLYQKVYEMIFKKNGTLFGKVMLLFIADLILTLIFFPLNNASLWVLYVHLMVVLVSFIGYPLLGLRTRADNRLANTYFKPDRKVAARSESEPTHPADP